MNLFYRHRKNGVHVFRVDTENRDRRIQLVQIASINRMGEVTPHKRHPATEQELAEIAGWHAAFSERVAAGDLSTFEKELARFNHFTHWVMQKAPPEDLATHADMLLMALVDMRQTVVRALSKSMNDRRTDEDD